MFELRRSDAADGVAVILVGPEELQGDRAGVSLALETGEDHAERERAAQPTSINRRLTAYRLLYRFCTDREIERGPGVPRPAPYYRGRGRDRTLGLHRLPRRQRLKLRVKTPHRLVEPLTASEVRHFLRSLRRYRDLAIVHLMLFCGLRSAEVLHLRCTDVIGAECLLRVRGKGNKERVMPLPELLERSIGDYLRWEQIGRAHV